MARVVAKAHRGFDLHTLPARLILSFVAVIALTTIVVGVPTLGVIRAAEEKQAWARVEQAAGATEALYAARVRELGILATLTAERPTLRALLQGEDRAALLAYLESIRTTTGLDLLAVLNDGGAVIAHADLPPGWEEALPAALTGESGGEVGLVEVGWDGTSGLAIQARAPVLDARRATIGTVVGAILLDHDFLDELSRETGVHHSLFQNGVRVATTLPVLPHQLEEIRPGLVPGDGGPFYVRAFPLELGEEEAVDLLALPAAAIVATQARIVRVLVGSAFLVVLLAAVFGYLLARRVTAPLHQLVRASEGIGRGDFETPVVPQGGVSEVATLGRALERMRLRLQAAYEDLRRAKAWSENLIASLAEGVVTVDAGGRITSFSPGAERILGWRAVEVIGRRYEAVFRRPAEGQGGASALAMPSGSITRELVVTREGRPIVVSVTGGARTTRANGDWERAFVFRDVSKEEEARRLREFFLANVSHEFKTPLSSLRAATELLAGELDSLSADELRELAGSIALGALRLEEMVDNLLSSASIHSGHFEVRPRPVDLEPVVEEILLTTRPLLAPRGQRLDLEIPSPLPPVRADPRRLRQVLLNLISNASKYGPEGAPIRLRVEARGEVLRVLVADRGPGIAPEAAPALFQPFARSRDEGRGVGLGLSIVKAIVDQHGGQVGVESAPGRGATFWFTLPVEPGGDESR